MEEIQKSPLILSRKFTVRSGETDISGHLRPGALVNYLIQAAIDSADELGFGLATLREKEAFWVLSRLYVEVLRPLRWQEKITVLTWPKDVDGVLFLRDFLILDESGSEVVRGLSGWLMIDEKSKRPMPIKESDREVFCSLKERNAADRACLERIAPSGNTSTDQRHIEPTYFDFDLNGHVTTTRYIDYMMDAGEIAFHQDYFLRTLRINFIREILPGDGLVMSRWINGNHHVFEGMSIQHQKPSVLARIEFEKTAGS